MGQMELQLPELMIEDFQKAWTRFKLVSAAKWNAEKQLTILPTLLWGKLIDFYTEFDEATKSSLSSLKKALQERQDYKKIHRLPQKPLTNATNYQMRRLARWHRRPGLKIQYEAKPSAGFISRHVSQVVFSLQAKAVL